MFNNNAMAKDYYKILGIPRAAKEEEIRKAFKKLARQYHPDMNPGNKAAEDKFKDISEAYDVLGDTKKRKNYDQFGSADFSGFGGGPGPGPAGGRYRTYTYNNPFEAGGQQFDMGDLGEMFGDLFGAAGARSRTRKRGFDFDFDTGPMHSTQRGHDLNFEVELDFLGAVQGTEKKIRLSHGVAFKVKIPPGVQDGSKIRLAGKGEPGIAGGESGDLYILAKIKPHPYFRRSGDNIELDLPVTLLEAIGGTTVSVPTLEGRVDLKIPAGIQSGQKLRLKNRGIANPKTKTKGDQYVIIQIKVPTHLDAEIRKSFVKLLENRQADPRAGLW